MTAPTISVATAFRIRFSDVSLMIVDPEEKAVTPKVVERAKQLHLSIDFAGFKSLVFPRLGDKVRVPQTKPVLSSPVVCPRLVLTWNTRPGDSFLYTTSYPDHLVYKMIGVECFKTKFPSQRRSASKWTGSLASIVNGSPRHMVRMEMDPRVVKWQGYEFWLHFLCESTQVCSDFAALLNIRPNVTLPRLNLGVDVGGKVQYHVATPPTTTTTTATLPLAMRVTLPLSDLSPAHLHQTVLQFDTTVMDAVFTGKCNLTAFPTSTRSAVIQLEFSPCPAPSSLASCTTASAAALTCVPKKGVGAASAPILLTVDISFQNIPRFIQLDGTHALATNEDTTLNGSPNPLADAAGIASVEGPGSGQSSAASLLLDLFRRFVSRQTSTLMCTQQDEWATLSSLPDAAEETAKRHARAVEEMHDTHRRILANLYIRLRLPLTTMDRLA